METDFFYRYTPKARLQKLATLVAHSFYLDVERDPAKSTFICGAGRSGTTWLAELLNYANKYRLLVEPFTAERVPMCRHFEARQYLRPDDENAEYFEAAYSIFSGRIRNNWVDRRNRWMITRQRLIKDVRSTLMLKWIRNRFPQMPIVFLVRHPCAVAISRTKLGYRTDLRHVYLRQDALMADHLAPFADEIAAAETAFEHHTVDWCVENLLPFRQLSPGDVHLVFYEDLWVNPKAELQRLFTYLKRPFDEAVLQRLNKPSVTARKKGDASAILSGESVIDAWRKYVSAEEYSAALRTTRVFGLDQIYGESSLPNREEAVNLMGRVRPAQAY